MKTLKSLAVGFMLTLAAVSCAVQEVETPMPAKASSTVKRVHFSAVQLETKTVFGEGVTDGSTVQYPTFWTDNDSQVAVSLNLEPAVLADVFPTESRKGADFEAEIDAASVPAPYAFYVLSPASALEAVSQSRKALTIRIPAVQTPLAGSVDEAAQVLFAKSPETQEVPEDISVQFSHVTAYGKLTLKNLPTSDAVSSVTLISKEQPFVGSWYYHVEDGSVEAKDVSSSLSLKTDASGAAWFALAPVDLAGKKLTVLVHTGAGVYEREITLKSTVDFSPGRVYGFSVNMESATFIENKKEVYYELVTDASTLKAGDEVIIASPQYSFALSTVQNNDNRGRTQVTISENKIYDPATAVQIITLEGRSDAWNFKVAENSYLYTTSSTNQNKQYLRSGAINQSSVFNAWDISISNGNATISAKVSNTTTKYLIYNNSRSVFAVSISAPGTGNNRVALYRKVEGSSLPATDDPILEETIYGAYLAAGNQLYNSGTDQLSREYNSDGTLTFAILAPVEDEVLEFSGIPSQATFGSAFTLQVTYISGVNKLIDKQFNVSVVKEDGARLWLTDGTNGFIVKR